MALYSNGRMLDVGNDINVSTDLMTARNQSMILIGFFASIISEMDW